MTDSTNKESFNKKSIIPLSSSRSRGIPKEVCFKLSKARQDPTKKNRWWLKYPEGWRIPNPYEAIIGIRSMYKKHTDFDFQIRFMVCAYNGETETDEIVVTLYMIITQDTTLGNICNEINKAYCDVINNRNDPSKPLKTSSFFAFYKYLEEDNSNEENCYMFLKTFGENKVVVTAIENANFLFEDDLPISTPFTTFMTKAWDRHNILINSSISVNDDDFFLGHTRPNTYTPIKYYRLTSTDREFWIDLYSSHARNCMIEVTLNEDQTPFVDIFIEAILLYESDVLI
ncbi:MAG: hypothetical protein LBM99_06275 [Bacillales bacterium]|jgi:hypothetical protein|nr:hypothetical protein [Bacillales bacterium]